MVAIASKFAVGLFGSEHIQMSVFAELVRI